MDRRTWLLVGTFLILYGGVVFITKSSSLSDAAKLVVIAGHTALYLSVIFVELSLLRQHFGTAGDWIRSLSNVGRAGKRHEIYRAMGNALSYMIDHAYVTYFNSMAPDETRNRGERPYHEQLHRAISEGGMRSFRRIIAVASKDTPAKRTWVKSESEFASRHANYQIRYLQYEKESDLPLNVQIFDSFVFLIDPSRDNEDTLPRDVHFLSEEIADIWFRYYRFIWDRRSVEAPPVDYFNFNEVSGAANKNSAADC